MHAAPTLINSLKRTYILVLHVTFLFIELSCSHAVFVSAVWVLMKATLHPMT
jgi:hypothetical protein